MLDQSFLQILAMTLVVKIMGFAFQNISKEHKEKIVVPPRIELGCQVPETCILSIVLRD